MISGINHVTLSVSDLDEAFTEIWQENTSPGLSLYFLDPSGNRLEIHAGSWQSRIAWLKRHPSADVEVFV